MAEETTTPDSAEVSKAKEKLEEYKKTVEEVYKIEKLRNSEQEKFYESVLENYVGEEEKANQKIGVLKDEISNLERQAAERAAEKDDAARRLIEEDIKVRKKRIEVLNAVAKAEGRNKRQIKALIEENIKSLDKFSSALDRSGRSILETATKTVAAMKLLGMQTPDLFKEARKALTDLDDARRELIPFMTSVEQAGKLQESLRKQAALTGIPITDLGDAAQKASADFGLFATKGAGVQSEIASFAAQLSRMGVTGGGSLIESIIADSGIENASTAIGVLKGLTVQMMELGVTPKQLFDDFNKLIPSFAMFGEAASLNIAKVSYMAQKAQVDVGSITGFGDNFKEYSGAQRAVQKINAIFGKPILKDPAELVRTFYAGGPGAALMLVKQKIVEAGIDLDEAFSGAAGAAKLQSLGGMGFGSAQDALRLIKAENLSPEQLDEFSQTGKIKGITSEEASKKFDEVGRATIPQSKQIEAAAEQMATQILDKFNIGLGKTGPLFDNLTKDLVQAFQSGFDKFMSNPFIDQAADAIGKAVDGVSSLPPEMQAKKEAAETLQETALRTNSEEIRQSRISIDKLTEATNNLVKKMEEGGGTNMPSNPLGFGQTPHLSLSIDSSFKKGVLKIVGEDSFKINP